MVQHGVDVTQIDDLGNNVLHTLINVSIQRRRKDYEYTLPAKNMEYFLFQRFFVFLWSVQGVSVLEIHFYKQILLWGELIST